MKKVLFSLLVGGFLSAQTSDLTNYDWFLSKIVTNSGQTINVPAKDGGTPASTFNPMGGTNYVFNSRYFNTSLLAFNTMSGSTNVTKTSGGCTSNVYSGTNMATVADFDQRNCNIYNNGTTGAFYNYELTTTGVSTKTLVFTDPAGNKVHYDGVAGSQLGTQENTTKDKTFAVYPNPARDVLNVSNTNKNSALKIYDFSGKMVYETKTTENNTKINITDLPKGQYILTIKNYKSKSFIKE